MLMGTTHITTSQPSAKPPLHWRFRVYSGFAVLALVFLMGRALYNELLLPAMLPASAWLDRGWDHMWEGEYATASRDFTHAAEKGAPVALMPIVWHVFYYRRWHDHPLAPRRIEILSHIPLVRVWMRPVELRWRDAVEYRANLWLIHDGWPHISYQILGVSCRIFDDHWRAHPVEVLTVVHAIDALRAHHDAHAYALFVDLEQRQPATYRLFWQSAPLLLRNYAQAAIDAGHPRDGRRLLDLYQQQPIYYALTYDDQFHGDLCVDPVHDEIALALRKMIATR